MTPSEHAKSAVEELQAKYCHYIDVQPIQSAIDEAVAEAVKPLQEAEKELDGRLGHDPEFNQVAMACEQYRLAEDGLPDEFDDESYTLSRAVCSVVSERDSLRQRVEELERDRERLDWLESCSYIKIDVDRYGNGLRIGIDRDDGIRAAIDSARKEKSWLKSQIKLAAEAAGHEELHKGLSDEH